jgi:hypothetical protein
MLISRAGPLRRTVPAKLPGCPPGASRATALDPRHRFSQAESRPLGRGPEFPRLVRVFDEPVRDVRLPETRSLVRSPVFSLPKTRALDPKILIPAPTICDPCAFCG